MVKKKRYVEVPDDGGQQGQEQLLPTEYYVDSARPNPAPPDITTTSTTGDEGILYFNDGLAQEPPPPSRSTAVVSPLSQDEDSVCVNPIVASSHGGEDPSLTPTPSVEGEVVVNAMHGGTLFIDNGTVQPMPVTPAPTEDQSQAPTPRKVGFLPTIEVVEIRPAHQNRVKKADSGDGPNCNGEGKETNLQSDDPRVLRSIRRTQLLIKEAERGVNVIDEVMKTVNDASRGRVDPLSPKKVYPGSPQWGMYGALSQQLSYMFSGSMSMEDVMSSPSSRGSSHQSQDGEVVAPELDDEALEMDMDEYEDDKLGDEEDDEEHATFHATRPVRHNTLYLMERCLWYFQATTLMLTAPISWPESFAYYASMMHHTMDFGIHWLYFVGLNLELDNVLIYWDLINFGMTIILPIVVVVLLFHFWTIPDYTEAGYTRKWINNYVFHWWKLPCGGFIKSFTVYLLAIGAALGACYLLRRYVGQGLDTLVGTAALGSLTVLWITFMITCYMLRRFVINSARGVPLVAADYIIKQIVAVKIRTFLFLLFALFVPTIYVLLKAVIPLYDWNDTHATPWRRPYNQFIPCYYMAFPPYVDPVTHMTMPVLQCDNILGVSVFCIAGTALTLALLGIPMLVYYLGEETFKSFKKTDWYDNFEFFNVNYQMALEKLNKWPKHRVMMEDNRQALAALTKLWATNLHAAVMEVKKVKLKVPGGLRRWWRRRWRRKSKKRSLGGTTMTLDEDSFSFASDGTPRPTPRWHNRCMPKNPIGIRFGISLKPVARMRHLRALIKERYKQMQERGKVHGPRGRKARNNNNKRRRSSGGFMERFSNVILRAGAKMKVYAFSNKKTKWRQDLTLQHFVKEFSYARMRRNEEYIMALNYFDDDHDLIISFWETVLDTSGYLTLTDQFTIDHRHWRCVQLAEMSLFCILLVGLQRKDSPSMQLGGLLLLEILSMLATWWYSPFLGRREAFLDYTIKFQLSLNAIFGLLGHTAAFDREFMGGLLILSNLITFGIMTFLLELLQTLIRSLIQFFRRSFDGYVVDFLFSMLDDRCYAYEQPNKGLLLLQQWDDLIKEEQWHMLLQNGQVIPKSLITRWERMTYVKWAAIRNLKIQNLRSWTGMTVLHAAMARADSNTVRWLLHAYPSLLEMVDDACDTPYITCLKATATKLLIYEESQTQRTYYELAKLFEILMSKELQGGKLVWDKRRYRFLRDRANPRLGTLTQLLASSCNLNPPKGFSQVSEWVQYGEPVVRYLADTLVASRVELDVSDAGLGHVATNALVAIIDSLAKPVATVAIKSLWYYPSANRVIHLNLSGNAMEGWTGEPLAAMLLANKALTYLDVSNNLLDDSGGVPIAKALCKNKQISTLIMHSNKLQHETGDELAKTLQKNSSLTHVDISRNKMGPSTFWVDFKTRKRIEGAGKALGRAFRRNRSVTCLNVAENFMGEELGEAIAEALKVNHTLVDLNLEQNELRPDSGMMIAQALAKKNSLTRLNIRKNTLGSNVGLMLASSLRTNSVLTSLDISANNLGTKSGKVIAMALRDNMTLTHLDMSENGLGPDLLKYMGRALTVNCSLTSLNLARSRFGICSYEGGTTKGMDMAMERCLIHNKVLVDLNLEDSLIRPSDLIAITTGIKRNDTLRHINLSQHALEDVSVMQMATRISKTEVHKLQLHDCNIEQKPGEVLTQSLVSSKRLRVLDLGGSKLGSEGAIRFAKYLCRSDVVLASLNLEGNQLGGKGGVAVARMLNHNTSLIEVNLSNNGLSFEFAREMAKSMRTVFEKGVQVRSSQIKDLNVSFNPLGDKGAKRLIHALRNNDITTSLNLSGTGMGPLAAKEVASLLRRSVVRWKILNLSDNDMGRENTNEILWAVRSNFSLRVLNLASNQLGPTFGTEEDEVEDNGVAMVEAVSTNFSLHVLDLSDNQLSAECGMLFVESLMENPSLTSIHLEKNSLDPESFEAVANILKHDNRVKDVKLASNHGGWKGCVAFADMLKVNNQLALLDLADNLLGERGPEPCISLAKALTYNASLRWLNLSKNRMGPEAGRAIAKALRDNPSLTYVDLQDNRFDMTVGQHMVDMLRVNITVMRLLLSDVEIGFDHYNLIEKENNERN